MRVIERVQKPIASRRWVAACCLSLAVATPAFAQTQVQIQPTNGTQTHALSSISYRLSTSGQTLVARTASSVMCARATTIPGPSAPGEVIDPNGYLASYSVQGMNAPAGMGLMATTFPSWAMFRTGERLAFSQMIYPVDPLTAPQKAAVSAINGICQPGALAEAPPEPIACPAFIEDNFEKADRIATRPFELGGTATIHSRQVAQTPTGLFYEHVITATGGPVSGVMLREQFPFRPAAPGKAPFKHSLDINSAWVCRATEGAQCGVASASDAGMGYAHLESASLDEGQCLRIVAMRPVDASGSVNSAFSGSVNAALISPRHDQGGVPSLSIETTRFDFD